MSRVYTKAFASLRLWGEVLDPLVVTSVLRLPPDHVHRTGEQRFHRTRAGKVVESGAPFPHGHWSMSSQAHVDSPRLQTHLAWVLAEIEPKTAALRSLLDQGVAADIFCYSAGSSPRPPAVPRSVRDRAHALGLEIRIDHYVMGPESDAV